MAIAKLTIESLSFAAYEVYNDQIIIRGHDINNHVFDEGVIRAC